MARFSVNTTRFDPYLGFKFKIKVDGQYVAALNKCSALKRTTEVTPWYEAGDPSAPRQIPGKTKYDPITLEAGVTHDTTFEEWANKVNNYHGEASMSLAGFRKDISIEVYNPQGSKVLAYHIYRCWVSELPSAAAARRGRQRRHDHLDQAGERGLGARHLGPAEPRET